MKSRVVATYIGSITIIFTIIIIVMLSLQTKFFEDYTDTNFVSSYRGKIIDVRRNRGWVYIELENGAKYNIGGSHNDLYSPSSLYGQVKEGDLIIKPLNSDSIFLVRNHQKLYFIMDNSGK